MFRSSLTLRRLYFGQKVTLFFVQALDLLFCLFDGAWRQYLAFINDLVVLLLELSARHPGLEIQWNPTDEAQIAVSKNLDNETLGNFRLDVVATPEKALECAYQLLE